jgi:hypothetical protein
VDQGRDAHVLESFGDVEGAELGCFRPTRNCDLTIAGIERDRDARGVEARRLGDERRIAHRRGADDDPGDALVEPGLDGADVANAAAELQGNRRRFDDALDRGNIDRLAGKGTVEIDHVEIFEAQRLEGLRLRRRIAVKHRRARHVALLEPHACAVLEVDGGKEDHDDARSTSSASAASRARLDNRRGPGSLPRARSD